MINEVTGKRKERVYWRPSSPTYVVYRLNSAVSGQWLKAHTGYKKDYAIAYYNRLATMEQFKPAIYERGTLLAEYPNEI